MRVRSRLRGGLVVLSLALSVQASTLSAGDATAASKPATGPAEPAATPGLDQGRTTPPGRTGRRRFRILADLVVVPLSLEYRQDKSFREYNEDATLTVQHQAKTGLGGSLGFEYDFSEHFGAIVTLGLVSRSAAATYDAALPHPLYFDQKRLVTGEVSGTSYRETTGELDVAYLGKAGRLSYSAFAGPSFFSTSADLVNSVQYSQSYPYDTVTVNTVPTSSRSKTGIGVNLGASVDYSLGGILSLGGKVRYSRAKITLESGPGDEVEVDAGGLQVSLGLRLRF